MRPTSSGAPILPTGMREAIVFGEGGDHFGFDEGGGDGVGGDAFLGELGGVGAGETEYAGFGGGVVGADDAAVLCGDGRETDDAAPAGGAHGGEDALGDEEDGGEVYAEIFVPDFFGDLVGGDDFADAGVVDEDADGAELGFGCGDEAVYVGREGDVGLDGDAFAAEIANGLRDGFGGCGLGAIVHGDVGASFG